MTQTGGLGPGPSGHPGQARLQAGRRVPRVPASVAQVRSWLRGALTDAAIDPACVEVVVLLASEVVTNAVIHTRSEDLLITVTAGSFVEVAVQDDSPHAPAVQPVDLLDAGGRGLVMVKALAASWGTRATGPGKTVWFRVAATA